MSCQQTLSIYTALIIDISIFFAKYLKFLDRVFTCHHFMLFCIQCHWLLRTSSTSGPAKRKVAQHTLRNFQCSKQSNFSQYALHIQRKLFSLKYLDFGQTKCSPNSNPHHVHLKAFNQGSFALYLWGSDHPQKGIYFAT